MLVTQTFIDETYFGKIYFLYTDDVPVRAGEAVGSRIITEYTETEMVTVCL